MPLQRMLFTGLVFLGSYLAASVKLSITPTTGLIHLGENKTFICKVEGGDAHSFIWTLPTEEEVEAGDHIKLNEGEYWIQMEIIRAVPSDNGRYTCSAVGQNGEELVKSVTVSVVQDPTFQNTPPVQQFDEGFDAIVLCEVIGIPAPTLSWKDPQEKIISSDTGHYMIQRTGTLIIRNIQASDAGTYQCVGRIDERNVQKQQLITVKVQYAPKFDPSDPELLYSWVGNPVNISCTVSAYPRAEISWSHNGKGLEDNVHIFTSSDSTRLSSVLQVPVNSTTDFSEYRCSASNALGNVSRIVNLREGGIPSAPGDLKAEPHSTTIVVTFSRPFDSGNIPVLGYWLEWRRDSTLEWTKFWIDDEPFRVDALTPYTLYHLRVAAVNGKGPGNYSDLVSVRTLSIRGEPDFPRVSSGIEGTGNNIRIYFEDTEGGGSPVTGHIVRFKEVKAELWDSVTVNGSDSFLLEGLNWGSVYEVEVRAENSMGQSMTTYLNVSTEQRPPAAAVGDRPTVGTGGVVGIILVIFLALLLVVDVVCYRTRRCGILMCLSVNLLGPRDPETTRLGPRDPETKRLDQELASHSVRMTSSSDNTSHMMGSANHC